MQIWIPQVWDEAWDSASLTNGCSRSTTIFWGARVLGEEHPRLKNLRAWVWVLCLVRKWTQDPDPDQVSELPWASSFLIRKSIGASSSPKHKEFVQVISLNSSAIWWVPFGKNILRVLKKRGMWIQSIIVINVTERGAVAGVPVD